MNSSILLHGNEQCLVGHQIPCTSWYSIEGKGFVLLLWISLKSWDFLLFISYYYYYYWIAAYYNLYIHIDLPFSGAFSTSSGVIIWSLSVNQSCNSFHLREELPLRMEMGSIENIDLPFCSTFSFLYGYIEKIMLYQGMRLKGHC